MKEKKRSLIKVERREFYLQNFRGQIWVETMVYTLIAFALIGLVLAFVKPKIEEIQDRSLIEQSINVLGDLDSIISSLGIPGNQRIVEISINDGSFSIDGIHDKMMFQIESSTEYSQSESNVSVGNVDIFTQKRGKVYDVTLTRDFSSGYDLRFENTNVVKEMSKSPTPYKLLIANQGEDGSGRIIVNMEIIG